MLLEIPNTSGINICDKIFLITIIISSFSYIFCVIVLIPIVYFSEPYIRMNGS